MTLKVYLSVAGGVFLAAMTGADLVAEATVP